MSSDSNCLVCRRSMPAVRPSCRGSETTVVVTANTSNRVCEACKKFHRRCQAKGAPVEKCDCSDTTKCRVCRYKLCLDALGRETEISSASSATKKMKPRKPSNLEFYKIPCAVCGFSSSGFHFGVFSCEGCKIFYGRYQGQRHRTGYTCLQKPKIEKPSSVEIDDFQPEVMCDVKSKCRKCRLQRCIDAGMTSTKVITGRYSQTMRKKIDSVLAETKAIIKKPRLRRPKTSVAEITGDVEDSSESDEVVVDVVSQQSPFSSSDSFDIWNPINYLPQNVGFFEPPPVDKTFGPCPVANEKAASSNAPNFSEWLIERCVDAAIRLAPIAQVKIVITRDMSVEQVVAIKADAFVIYVKAISEFLTALPGITHVDMHNRLLLYLYGFFPVLAAQLSLNFDHACQMPANLSTMNRNCCSFADGAPTSGHSTENDLLIKSYLCYVGNLTASTISNLKEFAIFCALLCFSPDNENLSQSGQIPLIRSCYEDALKLALKHNQQVEVDRRFEQFQSLLVIFRRGVDIFYAHMRDIPNRCSSFQTIANSLVQEFQYQFFMNIKQPTCPQHHSTT